jgi:hypothetical protein
MLVKVITSALVAVLLGVLTLAACSDREHASGPAVVYVRQGRQWPQPIDSASVHFVRVLRSDGTTVFTRKLSRPTNDKPVSHVALQVDPDEYRLVFFERDCEPAPSTIGDLDCRPQLLGPLTYRCEYALKVGEGETVTLVARVVLPRNDCEIDGE